MKRGTCYREVLPFAVMVAVECANVGGSTLFKAASDKGMSYRVFVVYSFSFASITLAPLAFIFHRNSPIPRLSISYFGRILVLGTLAFSVQMLGYKGIQYSSPTLASALSNLIPAFTTALALLFRMEKLQITSIRGQAKILGTILSVSGALVVILYEGPIVIKNSLSSGVSLNIQSSSPLSLNSSNQDWIFGGFLLVVDYLILSIWYIYQAHTLGLYPAEFLMVFLFNLTASIISAPICFMMEPDINAWKINSEITWVALLYAGVVSSSLGGVVHSLALRVKGPVFVALFRPLSIAIAAIMGVIFLGDTLFLGSVIGAILISVGFYVVMWGKLNEETAEDDHVERVPLLH